MNEFDLTAEPREDVGKGASRRLRRTGRVPAVVYGGDKDPTAVSLDHNDLLKHLEHQAFYSHILNLKVGRKKEKVVLKDVQRHPFKAQLLHMDLQRVDAKHKLTMRVPLKFINEDQSPGKRAGCLISHHMIEVEVKCLAKDLPEFIEVDLSELEAGHAVHVSELTLPKGVAVITHGEQDQPVVSALKGGRAVEEVEEEAEGEEAPEVPGAPE